MKKKLNQTKSNQISSITLYSSIIILILLDLLTKTFFTNKFYGNGFIFIQYIQNLGSSFGIFSNVNLYSTLILILSIIVLIIIIYKKEHFLTNKYLTFVFVFFVAGIIGNSYDRLFFGFVRDFIGLKHLFIFNLADLYFSIAFILFMIPELSDTKNLKSKKMKKYHGK